MKLRSSLTNEEISQGFVEHTDIFGNKVLSERLTGLFKRMHGGSVCLLDGQWGTGKSTFVKQWAAELRKKDYPCVYFDAFASDYIDTPYTAIAGLFIRAAHDARKGQEPAAREFLRMAARVGKALASTTAKIGVKAATLGVLDGSEIDGLPESIADGLGEITEASVSKVLENHTNRENEFQEMRRSFMDLVKSLRGSELENNDKPLIIFIDELDRCRPDFALGILEILKHFFNCDHVHFVMVTNKKYLEMGVSAKYGFGSLSSEYLEKFYDFIVVYDLSYVRHDERSVIKFINKNLDRLIENRNQDDRYFKENIVEYCFAYKMTLRQIENFCINSSIAYLSVLDLRIFKPGFLIAYCAMMKTLDLEKYKRLKNGELSFNEAQKFLLMGSWDEDRYERILKVIQWHLDKNIDPRSSEWSGFGSGGWQVGLDRLGTLKYIANAIIDRFSV